MSLFGAKKIDLSQINIESETPNIILYAVPAMVFFSVIEILFSFYQKREYYEKKETVGSILVE